MEREAGGPVSVSGLVSVVPANAGGEQHRGVS